MFPGPFGDNMKYRVIAGSCSPHPDNFKEVTHKFASDDKTVLICETKNGYYVRHHKFQFEQYFMFGLCNAGYDDNRVIFVPK